MEACHLRRGRVGCLEVLRSREREAHRPFEREGSPRGQRLDERELAPERAAERLRDDADPLQR